MSDSYRPNKEKYSLKNPFKKSHNNKTPEGEPLENVGSGSFLGSKKTINYCSDRYIYRYYYSDV